MLKKIFRKNEALGEYFDGLKLIYQEDMLLVINYERRYSKKDKRKSTCFA